MMKNKMYIAMAAMLLVGNLGTATAFADDKNDYFADRNDQNTNVEINQNGRAIVRGATVVSVNNNVIVANSVLGQSTLTWTAYVSSSTKVQAKNGRTLPVGNIVAGDKITMRGNIQGGNSLNINLELVRDISRTAPPQPVTTSQIIEGTIVSPLASSTLPTSFMLRVGNAIKTINISTQTIFLSKLWTNMPFNSIQLGDNIRVFGAVTTGSDLVTGFVVRDTSR